MKQQIRFARSHDGVRLAWATTGSGPPLIKAATWLSHLEYDWDSPVWGHLVRELSRRGTYVRYDERGCGLSDWTVDDLSFDELGGAISRRWPTPPALDRFALLGISQGASIAIDYAVRHPERVTHLVLHGGYARGRLVRSNTPEQREEAEMMTRLAELGWGKADPSFRQFFTTPVHPGRHGRAAPVVQRTRAHLDLAGQCGPLHARVRAHRRDRALLPQVRCPTLVLHSRHEVRVPFDEGRLIASAHSRRALRADRQPQPPAAGKRARLAALDRRSARLPAGGPPRGAAALSMPSPAASASCSS